MHDTKYWQENWLKRANNYLGLSQGLKDPVWVDRQVSKGRLSFYYKKVIQNITPSLEAIYPGRWDLQFDTVLETKVVLNEYTIVDFNETNYELYLGQYGGEEGLRDYLSFSAYRKWPSYCTNIYIPLSDVKFVVPSRLLISNVYIIIHFPEVTVRNSRDESIEIKDLFTKTMLLSDGDISTKLFGARSTFTINEMSNGYIHSHLSAMAWNKYRDSPSSKLIFQKFCLGESELIDFARIYNSERRIPDFENYLYMIQTVASWESVEGGPHISMRNTIQKDLGIPDTSIEICEIVMGRLALDSYRSSCNIDWIIKDNKYCIVDNEKFEDFLRSAYGADPIDNRLRVYKDEKGNYFVPTSISKEDAEVKFHDFIPFRGQKFNLKTEGKFKLLNKHKWYINPKIKEYVKSRLESICAKAQVKKYTIEWLNKAHSNRRVSQQGEISMQQGT